MFNGKSAWLNLVTCLPGATAEDMVAAVDLSETQVHLFLGGFTQTLLCEQFALLSPASGWCHLEICAALYFVSTSGVVFLLSEL